jgi:amidase
MTVKESFDLKGHPTTWGFEDRRSHRAKSDALAIERIEAAGAVVLGKTNVPVALAEWQAYNPIYGVTSSPWNQERTPGGSSGGAAASVSAGFSALEIGTDIGGSLRVPAHFCGIFTHKPTFGLCPMRGHSLTGATAGIDISVLGPLARSARDLRLALGALAGPDPLDTHASVGLPEPRARHWRDLRIAVWSREPGQATSNEISEAIDALADELEREGAKVSRSARPELDPAEAFHIYMALLGVAMSARDSAEELARKREARKHLREDDMSADAILARSAELSHHEWLRLDERRHQIMRAWSAFFKQWDVLLCPPFATTALPHLNSGTQSNRTYPVNGQQFAMNEFLFWSGLICGYYLPASVAPIGRSAEGLPIGVQIVGPMHGDLTTIQTAEWLEQAGHAFVPPPGWAD